MKTATLILASVLLYSTALRPVWAQESALPEALPELPLEAVQPGAAEVPTVAAEDPFRAALEAAYDKNPRIKASQRLVEQQDERVSQAIANFRPNLSADYNRGRQRTRFEGSNWSYGDTETQQLTLEQPIFQGGANIYRYSSAKENMLSARNDFLNSQQQVLLDAIIAYMDVVQNYSLLELSQNNQEVLERQLTASRDRFEVGDVTRTDVAQSEARLSRSQADAIQAKANLEGSLANFERVVGYKPPLPLPSPNQFPPLPADIDAAIERAIANNPSIDSFEHLRNAAEDDVGVNVAALLPQVSLVGTMSRQEGAGVTGASQFDTDSVQMSVSIPLYQRGAEYSRVREAKVLAKRREHLLLDTEQSVREGTIQAWENWQAAVSTITAQESAIQAAEIALDGVRQEQQYGARTILDVLDAEQELFVARVNLVRAQRTRIVSIYNMMLVLGDLLPGTLQLGIDQYDPAVHYDDVKWQLIGF